MSHPIDLPPILEPHGSERLDEGGTLLLDLVSAVDHLRRGYRPGFTVWDALAEAIDWSAKSTPEQGLGISPVGRTVVMTFDGVVVPR